MASRQVTAAELKTIDPKRFEKEYWSWCDYALWDEWTDPVVEWFKEDLAPYGVTVDHIYYDGIGGGGYPRAAFQGSIEAATFMEKHKNGGVPLSELYPAAYLALKVDQSWANVSQARWGGVTIEMHENTDFVAPTGIFSGLAEDDWQELISDQARDCQLYTEIEAFLKDMCNELAHKLDAEYEYLTSEESFIESCECNEVTFDVEIEDETEICG